MNLVRVIEIIDEKEGKRKVEREDGTVDYVPWHWRRFKGETSIDGETKIIYANTFSHIEPDSLYQGELNPETYKGKRKWKFENVTPFEQTKPKGESKTTAKSESSPPQSTVSSNVPPTPPSSTLDTRIAALKCTLLYYNKANVAIKHDDVIATAQRFEIYLATGK